MKKPLVSVIIPVYNHEFYIKEMIESVVHQTYGFENIQLIVIDDCSLDNSGLVVQEQKNTHQFYFSENKVNKGICKNINDALTLAKGEYICITGSDDYWTLDKLTKQVAYMQNQPNAAVCSGNVIRVNSSGENLPFDKQIKAPNRIYTFADIFLRDFPFSSTCAMIRKSVLDQVGTYDEKCKIEDYYMWLKIAHAGYEIHFLEDLLGYYRIHNTNTILKSSMIYSEMCKILNQYKSHTLYPKAVRRLKIVYFPQIAQISKRKAIGLLPAAISNTKFFYRGIYYLLTPLEN